MKAFCLLVAIITFSVTGIASAKNAAFLSINLSNQGHLDGRSCHVVGSGATGKWAGAAVAIGQTGITSVKYSASGTCDSKYQTHVDSILIYCNDRPTCGYQVKTATCLKDAAAIISFLEIKTLPQDKTAPNACNIMKASPYLFNPESSRAELHLKVVPNPDYKKTKRN